MSLCKQHRYLLSFYKLYLLMSAFSHCSCDFVFFWRTNLNRVIAFIFPDVNTASEIYFSVQICCLDFVLIHYSCILLCGMHGKCVVDRLFRSIRIEILIFLKSKTNRNAMCFAG